MYVSRLCFYGVVKRIWLTTYSICKIVNNVNNCRLTIHWMRYHLISLPWDGDRSVHTRSGSSCWVNQQAADISYPCRLFGYYKCDVCQYHGVSVNVTAVETAHVMAWAVGVCWASPVENSQGINTTLGCSLDTLCIPRTVGKLIDSIPHLSGTHQRVGLHTIEYGFRPYVLARPKIAKHVVKFPLIVRWPILSSCDDHRLAYFISSKSQSFAPTIHGNPMAPH